MAQIAKNIGISRYTLYRWCDQHKPIGDAYYCRYYDCEREGDCDIHIHVTMRGGITKEVREFCDLPQKYPDVTVQERLFMEMNGIVSHRIFKTNCWEVIWTLDDALEDYEYGGFEFSPSMLEIKTFRKVCDYDGNLISEKRETVPFPMERMQEDIREEYEEWKKDPIKWEENKEKERLETRFNDTQPSDDDYLPF